MILAGLSLALTAFTLSDSTFQIQAVRAGSAPLIDGIVSAEEWADAARVTRFIQFEPHRGDPGSERTEALLLYDASALYVAFKAWDPRGLTAQLTRRDEDLFTDDAVAVLLDTFHDRQSAYVFAVNPLGTQADARVANDGRTIDLSWDETWQSATQRTEWGWSVEIAIPLASLRYRGGDDQTWGINFGRSLRRSLEVSFWAGPLETSDLQVSRAGEVLGLQLPPRPRRGEVIAHGLSTLQRGESADWDAGLNVRIGITSRFTFDGTVNPDFATIEADQEQVNLTRFELSLPEKRPFFLEGGELFRQRIRTFYSRRIADIRGGAKLIGKRGPWTVAFLGALSEPADGEDDALYGVGRIQRDLGRSSLAVTWADRRIDGYGQGSVGMDATLFFTRTLGMTAQMVQSYGPFDRGTEAFFIRPSYDSNTGHFHVRYTQLGENFADNANVVGFIRDDNRRELDSAVEKIVWFGGGPLENFAYDSNYNIYWGKNGTLRSWKVDESIELELRNRFSARVAHTEEFKLFEEEFRNRETSFKLGYNTREFESVELGYAFGRNFGSGFRLLTAGGHYKPTDESSLEYELQRLTLDPDPEDRSTWIHVLRGSQFFTNDLFLQLFFQSNSAIERNNVQVVFVYRYLPPFGTVQVAYQKGTAAFGERSEQGSTFFLKATWVF